jgi:hypothetical protein
MYDEDRRPLAQTLGSAALGLGLGLGILGLGFMVSRIALPDNVVAAMTSTPAPSPTPATTPATPGTATPTLAPATAPAKTADPLSVAAYSGQGLRLAAITIPAGYTFTSPIAGKVSISLYQWADGQIKTGLADQPSYPYIFIRSADREIKLRPGIVDKDIQLLVKDGDTIDAGAPLLKTLTTGASSWATFYDAKVTAQIVASAVNVQTNQELDPVPLFKR